MIANAKLGKKKIKKKDKRFLEMALKPKDGD